MKKFMVICAPVTSSSGYGDHARDLVRSFMNHNKYDIKIMDVRWGETPRNALNKNNTEDKEMLDLIIHENINKQPDVYVDIRIPNEFDNVGKYNIGITAGIETTVISQKWIEGCNKMDLVIVPSEHSKETMINTIYDKFQNLPDGKQGPKVGELKVTKPVEVLFEGANEDIYKPLDKDEIDSEFFDWLNDEVPEKFAFLFLGQWTKGGYGEDRKDISRLIKIFYEAFANKKKQPALILKTCGATFSVMDREECLKRIKNIKSQFPSDWSLPNVYLLHGEMSDKEINYLYNHPKVKSMVSLTHGEGFGRPLLEATMVGLPVITTGWSGHLDFLDKDSCVLIGGRLEDVPKSIIWKDIIIEGSQWFVVNESDTYKIFNHVFENPLIASKKADELMDINRSKFTLNKMTEKLDKIMKNHMKDVPQQVGLNLPKLKKVNSESNLKEMKLPKLKKITKEIS